MICGKEWGCFSRHCANNKYNCLGFMGLVKGLRQIDIFHYNSNDV